MTAAKKIFTIKTIQDQKKSSSNGFSGYLGPARLELNDTGRRFHRWEL
jgi:hypothetical protein